MKCKPGLPDCSTIRNTSKGTSAERMLFWPKDRHTAPCKEKSEPQMPFILNYLGQNHEKAKRNFQGFAFDKPNTFYIPDQGKLVFSGWILPYKERKAHLEIINKKNHNIKVITLEIERPDITEAYNLDNTKQKYGFYFEIETKDDYDILICSNEEKITIWTISYYLSPLHDSRLREIGETYKASSQAKSDTPKNICQAEYKFPSEHIKNFLERNLILNSRQFISYILETSPNSPSSQSAIEESLNEFKSPYWSIDAAISATRDSFLRVASPLTGAPAYCIGSKVINDYNYLAFLDGDIIFYLIQHCSNVALILPSHLCIIALSEGSWLEDHLRKNSQEIFNLLVNNPPEPKRALFAGLFVAQSRPYHYFYDYLYGLELAIQKGLNPKRTKFYSVIGCDFIQLNKAFETNEHDIVETDSNLNKKLKEEGLFIIAPCVQFSLTQEKAVIESLDRKLVSYANRHFQNKSTSFIGSKLKENFPIIWISASSEKRSWAEQIDGYSKIISKLKTIFPKLAVVIDGRTSTASQALEELRTQQEEYIFKKISEEHQDITFLTVIGSTSIEKIFFANLIDFFITPYSTDSMYPSRIAQKSGIVFSPKSIGADKKNHIHHDIIEVPEGNITEIPSESHPGVWHFSSVSINWSSIYDCVFQLLTTRAISKFRKIPPHETYIDTPKH